MHSIHNIFYRYDDGRKDLKKSLEEQFLSTHNPFPLVFV